MILEAYLSRKRRDDRARELRGQGYKVSVRTSSGSQLHPMYIEDWDGPEREDTGFGNTVYKTVHRKLYHLEARLPR